MADTITGKIEPSALGGQDIYQFTLDGIATAKQMDKLISLTKDLLKEWNANADSLKEFGESAETASKSMDKAANAADAMAKSQEKHSRSLDDATTLLTNIFHKRFSFALNESDKALSLFAGSVGFAYTGLKEYSKSLSEGLKRGVGGSIFDLAIASKSAGVSLETFTKSLGESGGGFASLGDNATDGAMQFGYLNKRVREATASVGNLGMSNDELAMLTAQQVKIAVSQGFKGKAAQETVIRNTRILGSELDNLAARTGKSTLELAQAAAKLAQDPIVANFVKTAQAGGKEVSAAVQSFAASMKGVFGEQGEQFAKDVLQSSLSGLPLIITKTGKDMILASNGLYNEFERLGAKVKMGGTVDEQDRQRLRDMAQREVKERGAQLRQFAMLGGSVGESANAILKMAQEAEFYNSEEGKRQRRQSEAAKQFNSELNKLQASLQEALIPFLQAMNAVDWGTVFKVVSFIPRKIADFIEGIRSFFNNFPVLGDVLGVAGDFISKFVGAGVGILTTLGLIATAHLVYQKTIGAVSTLFGGLSKELSIQQTKYGMVGKALDTFTAALKGASVSVIGGKGSPGPIGSGGATIEGNRARRRAAGLSEAAAAAEERADRINRAAELRRQDPSLSPADALKKAGNQQKWSNIGAKITSPKALGIGMAAGIGLDIAGDIAKEKGHENLGKAFDVGSSAIGMAGTGAMIGSMIAPGLGTAVGAALGGVAGGLISVWKNFWSDESGKISDAVKQQGMTAAEKAEAEQKQLIEQNKRLLDEMRGLREETGYGNQINARGVSYQASTERQLSNIRYTQQ